MCLLKGKTKSFYVFGILLGLIWHIHIALIPLVALIPLSIYLSKVKVPIRQVIFSVFWFLVLMSPFFLFEIRHQFSQSFAFIDTVMEGSGVVDRFQRFIRALDSLTVGLTRSIIYKISLNLKILLMLFIFIFSYLMKKTKLLTVNQKIIIVTWPLLLFVVQFFSSNEISDHYFNGAAIIGILILALFIAEFKLFGRIPVILFVTIMLLTNLLFLFSYKIDNGYFYKKELVEFIKKDYELRQYPCVGISYIADFGTGVGFRFLLWKNQIRTISPNINIPVYDIIIQDKVDHIEHRFGGFGLNKPRLETYDYSLCTDKKYQEVLPLGFVD